MKSFMDTWNVSGSFENIIVEIRFIQCELENTVETFLATYITISNHEVHINHLNFVMRTMLLWNFVNVAMCLFFGKYLEVSIKKVTAFHRFVSSDR